MYINKVVLYIIASIIIILCGLVVYFNYKSHTNAINQIEVIEEEGIVTQYYSERDFSALKKENKELYDSLKKQQKDIESLTQFKYKAQYTTDTIYIEPKEELDESLKALPNNTYIYEDETDTLSYKLKINSKLEPNWYQLSAEVKDKFTIVNKDYGNGQQITVIESENKGDITDVTAWQKPKTTKWYNRFSFGPTVSVGYDPINRNVGIVVGVGVTYNILGK